MPVMKLHIAALSFELKATGNEIQLLPAGKFRAADGRPATCDAWFLDADVAASLIALAQASVNDLVIDYEHQTLRSAKNGQPAPAAGWFKSMEWREALGLFAIDVRWTAKAQAMIAANEYRFISAVFSYDPKTGRIIRIYHAALTNTPALDGMDEVALAAASLLLADLSSTPPTNETAQMNEELLNSLRWMLNLPITSTADEVIAELQKVINQLSGGAGTAAASVNLLQILQDNAARVADLSQKLTEKTAALSTGVPQDVVVALQHEMAALRSELDTRKAADMDALIVAALADGRLTKALEPWARENATKNPQVVTDFLSAAKPLAALTQMQSSDIPPAGNAPAHGLDADTLAVCSALGVSPEDYAATLNAEV